MGNHTVITFKGKSGIVDSVKIDNFSTKEEALQYVYSINNIDYSVGKYFCAANIIENGIFYEFGNEGLQ